MESEAAATSPPAAPSVVPTAAAPGTGGASGSATVTSPTDEPAAVRPQATEPAAVKPQATRLPAGQPAAVKPAAQQIRRPVQPQKPPDEPEYRPGDLICSNCGAGNDPARRFCRRCGTSLVTAIVAQKPPWYRRIFRRRNRALKAGERPRWMGDQERKSRVSWVHRLLRVQRLFGVVVGLAVFAGLGAYVAVPSIHQQVNQGIDQVRKMLMPTYQPITPTKFVAPAIADHPIDMAFDQGNNTFWADKRTDSPTITVDFPRSFDLGVVVFQTSPSATFTQFDRPKTVVLTFPGTNAAPITLNLKDDKVPIITGGLNAPAVSRVVISFTDYYPADQTGQDVVAITDIQFQERR